MTFFLKSNIKDITDLPTCGIKSVSIDTNNGNIPITINSIDLKISPFHNLISDIIKICDKKLLIISILKFNDQVINNEIITILNDYKLPVYSHYTCTDHFNNFNMHMCKIIHFKQITNILHLVIYNNLDIDILLYTLLFLYYIKINVNLGSCNDYNKNCPDRSILIQKIINFDKYKFNIINTENNYYDIFLQNQNTDISIHNNSEIENLKSQISSLKDEVKIYKNIVNKLIEEMNKINEQNNLLEELKKLIK